MLHGNNSDRCTKVKENVRDSHTHIYILCTRVLEQIIGKRPNTLNRSNFIDICDILSLVWVKNSTTGTLCGLTSRPSLHFYSPSAQKPHCRLLICMVFGFFHVKRCVRSSFLMTIPFLNRIFSKNSKHTTSLTTQNVRLEFPNNLNMSLM